MKKGNITKEEREVLQEMLEMMWKKMRHDLFYHGFGFCDRCGELRKRCKCQEGFLEPADCKCKSININ